MNGITLQKLNVVLQAQYGGYKQDMEAVKSATKSVAKTVATEKEKIDKAMNSVQTSGSRKALDKLAAQLARQQEKIAVQEAAVHNLKRKYQDLMTGITQDTTTSGLERQLAAAQKALDKLDAQLQPLLDKLTTAEEMESFGLKLPEIDAVLAQIDALNPAYDALDSKVDRLKKQLTDAKLNPQSTTTAQKLQQEIDLAQDKLARLKDTAAATENQINEVMTPKGNIKDKINQVIHKMTQMSNTSKKSSRHVTGGFEKIGNKIDHLKRRITGVVASVFIFNVLSKGLTALRESTGRYLKTNEDFNRSLSVTKTNLKVAFMPIYQHILPAINTFMAGLANVTRSLANFTANLFGTTYDDSYKAAQGIEQAAAAMDKYNASSKKLGLASFDELNNMTTSPDAASGQADFEAQGNKALSFLETIWQKIEPFRAAISNLWQDGLSKVQNFAVTGIKDFYDYFLVPLGTWAFGTSGAGFTRLVDCINNQLNRVDWDTINQNLKAFWIAIKPYAEAFGEGIIDFLDGLAGISVDILNDLFGEEGPMVGLTNWLNNNDPDKARKWGTGLMVLGTGFFVLKGVVPVLVSIGKAFTTYILPALTFLKSLNFATIFAGMNPAMWSEVINQIDLRIDWQAVYDIPELGTVIKALDALVGGIVETISHPWESLKKIFAWEDTIAWFDECAYYFGQVFSSENFLEFGENILLGIGLGITGAVTGLVEPIYTIFEVIWENICTVFDMHSPSKKMEELGANILLGVINGFKDKIAEFGTAIADWWTDDVSPWFTAEKWLGIFDNIKAAAGKKWEEIKNWWDNSTLKKWWTESVTPWFKKDTWINAMSGIKTAFADVFKGAANVAVNTFNGLIDWLNTKLTITIPSIPAWGIEGSTTQLITIPTIPQFAGGGYPTSGQLFVARENGINEFVGAIGNQSAVANNTQIVQAVSGGVEDGTYRAISPIFLMLREMIGLLQVVAAKDFGNKLPSQDIFDATLREAWAYYQSTGKNPFEFD